MENQLVFCDKCQKEVKIILPGAFTQILECNHVIIKTSVESAIKSGAGSLVEAQSISNQLSQTKELPKIDGNELVTRALSTVSQHYEDFFNAENPIIEDIVKKHGKDNAVLIFTAIHAHLSKTLFAVNRFRNLYYVKIEQLRKEVEDKAVKDLIQNHDFHYDALKATPKKIKNTNTKTGTDIDKAKAGLAGLTDKDGKPVDVTKVLANLMWKQDKKKEEYKEGLDKIKESITKEK